MTGSWLLPLAIGIAGTAAFALPACSSDDPAPSNGPPIVMTVPTQAAPPDSVPDPFDVPIAAATAAERDLFTVGDRLFETPLRDADGLGPLYTRTSCGACHATGARGPGAVQKMVVVLADGVTPSEDQSALPFGNTVHPLYTGGGTRAVLPPGPPVNVKVTTRVGPPIVGRGYVEAVLDSEIERVAREQAARSDAIHGRINHVVYASEANPDTRFHQYKKGDIVIGRFGLKGRIATLDDFTADALQGDMGITNPLRPTEFANPDGLSDDLKRGVDVTIESVNVRAMYVRLTAIPQRAFDVQGASLFAQAKCSACHVPSLRTRPDYPIAPLADIDAPIYTDVLLHDMGDALADGIKEGEAKARDWRTPPLIGLRFLTRFLHDSRATSLEEAILFHDGRGSEAAESVALFRALPDAERARLLAFVGSL
jgi:CxxC motif-containing protein (DUF1111 family)